jgi:hypothetical protein
MTGVLPTILAVGIADFRERSRRYSFWIFLVVIAYATYLFIPGAGAPYTTVRLGAYRGLYNSAWISSQVTLMTVTILSLVGFYFVKGAISREMRLKTQELVASSPISDISYLAGKTLSNCLVLFSMIAVLAITSGILQIARGEDRSLHLLALLAPYCLVMAPLMIALAALAVFFDSIKLLRGGMGNVAFFVLWVAVVSTIGINQGSHSTNNLSPMFDLFGIRYLWSEMMNGCAAAVNDYQPWQGVHSLGFNFGFDGSSPHLKTFVFNGVHWSKAFLIGRLLLLSATGAIIAFASYSFRRFDEERTSVKQHLFKKHLSPTELATPSRSTSGSLEAPRITALTPIVTDISHLGLTRLLIAELRIALNRISRWWYIVAGGIVVAGILTPFGFAYKFLLAAAWFWPMLIWSALGCRDQLYDTRQMVQSTPGGVWAQLLMQWLAGFVIAVGIGSFIGVRAMVSGDIGTLAHWLIGAMFIPSLAMTCGIMTSGRKLFEVIYTILFYIGPLNKVPLCDFTGSAIYGNIQSSLFLWGAITGSLLLATILVRKWQLSRN